MKKQRRKIKVKHSGNGTKWMNGEYCHQASKPEMRLKKTRGSKKAY